LPVDLLFKEFWKKFVLNDPLFIVPPVCIVLPDPPIEMGLLFDPPEPTATPDPDPAFPDPPELPDF
jgi:hypothetical protein